jgi:UDP-glucose 4-epimerase
LRQRRRLARDGRRRPFDHEFLSRLMRYLITGGAGFIGSHLADHLIAAGHEVVAFDNLSTGRLANIQHLADHERFRLVLGSVLDETAVDRAVERVDRVVHLAAAVGVKLIMEQPVDTIVTNVRGTENVLRAASRASTPVLVASTSEVYGKMMQSEPTLKRLREDGDWRLGPTTKRRWAYACSKAMDEFLALAYWEEKRLPTITARFFNTVGPRQTGQYGMVVPRFVQKALLNEPLVVHGDGTQTRCFNHVSDAVSAVVTLLDTPGAVGGVFNIGNDNEVTINELAERVIRLADSSSEIVHVPYDSVYPHGFEDMQRRTPCLDLLRSLIDYTPRHTLDSTIESVIDHYQHGGDAA